MRENGCYRGGQRENSHVTEVVSLMGNGRYRGGQYILPLNLLMFLFIKTCQGRGRTLCLQK